MAESPAFQQFALRSAAWAKRLVETPLPKVRGGGGAQKPPPQQQQQRQKQQQQQQQQQQQHQQQSEPINGDSFAVMRRRAAAFGSALADELKKDVGLDAKPKNRR